MRRLLTRSLVVVVAVLGMLVPTAPPIDAAYYYPVGNWTYAGRVECCDVWYRETDVYEQEAGLWWYDGWEYWTEFPGWVANVHVFGPIVWAYANYDWETGPLRMPTTEIHFSHMAGGFPVYQQNYWGGVIRWHSTLCRCYSWGGWSEVILY